jgi:type VI secretion system protein ImpK
MTPQFARAVDPVFLYVLDLLERIREGRAVAAVEERPQIARRIDQAGAMLGATTEWELAKYAIASWIDEVLVEAPWDGRDWWSNNVLEVELFNSRLCNEQFYLRAREASGLPRRDALEVFYDCVVLGFRGLYRDPQLAAVLTPAHGLPADLETWARQAALGIHLGQGRPPLARPTREIAGAPPLRSKTRVVWTWLAVVLLATSTVIAYDLLISSVTG